MRGQAHAESLTLRELRGRSAYVSRSFGPQASHLTQFPDQKFIEDTFPLRGWRRVSRLACNPKFVLFEEHLDQVTDVNARHLAHWTGGTAYLIRSQIAPYGLNREHSIVLGVPDDVGEHVFTAMNSDGMRSMSYISWNGPSMELHVWGEPWPFEDAEDENLDKDAFISRNRICTFLERVGIDPESAFERRELEDPILFSEDHPGVAMPPAPDAAARYKSMVEDAGWFEKVQAGIWF